MELEELAAWDWLPAEMAEGGNPAQAVAAKPFESDADRDDCPAWVDAYEL